MKQIFTILLISVFTLNFAQAQNQGDVAPDFKLTDLSNMEYLDLEVLT